MSSDLDKIIAKIDKQIEKSEEVFVPKPVDASDDINEPRRDDTGKGWLRGRSPIEIWNRNNPNAKEIRKAAREKAWAATREKARIVQDAKKKANELLPTLLAVELLEAEDDGYVPPRQVVEGLKKCVEMGLSFDAMRREHFNKLSQKAWAKITRYVFKDQIYQVEDLGINLIKSRQEQLRMMKKRLNFMRKELRQQKRKAGTVNLQLLKMIKDDEDKYFALEKDFAQTLSNIGAVGEKNKLSNITINMSTPRPAKKEAKDITPKEEAKVIPEIVEELTKTQ